MAETQNTGLRQLIEHNANPEIAKQLKVIVCLIKLPAGNIETQINHATPEISLEEKLKYILEAYGEDMKLIRNPEVSIISFCCA